MIYDIIIIIAIVLEEEEEERETGYLMNDLEFECW